MLTKLRTFNSRELHECLAVHSVPDFHAAVQPVTPLRCKQTWIQTSVHRCLGKCPQTQGSSAEGCSALPRSGQSTTNSGKYLILSVTSGLQVKAVKLLLQWSMCIGALPNQGLKKLQIFCLLNNMQLIFPMAHFSLSWIPLGTKCLGILWLKKCKTRSRATEPTWGAVAEDSSEGLTWRLDDF